MTQQETWNYYALGQLDKQVDFDGNEIDYAYYVTGSSYGSPGQLETRTVKYPSGIVYDTVN